MSNEKRSGIFRNRNDTQDESILKGLEELGKRISNLSNEYLVTQPEICPNCEKDNCLGKCTFDIEMLLKRDKCENILDKIPAFRFVLQQFVNTLFSTDLEARVDGKLNEDKTKELNEILYKRNKNNVVNIDEIKRAVADWLTFGVGYLFYDDENNDFYHLKYGMIDEWYADDVESDHLIKPLAYFGYKSKKDDVNLIKRNKNFALLKDGGLIAKPECLVKLEQDNYFSNSDKLRVAITVKASEDLLSEMSQTAKYGEIFINSNVKAKDVGIISATMQKTKDLVDSLSRNKRLTDAKRIKSESFEGVTILDKDYDKAQQFKPVKTLKDYQFITENPEKVMAEAFGYPLVLIGADEEAGNISKEAMIEQAQTNLILPRKQTIQNALSYITQRIIGAYVAFMPYETKTEKE